MSRRTPAPPTDTPPLAATGTPAGAVRRQRLAREIDGDHALLQAIGATADLAARRAGPHLACRPGCTPCCHGPFPINALDARRLRRGLAELRSTEPARATEIAQRAAEQAALFQSEAGDDLSDDALDGLAARHAALPCPALDPESGRCALYAYRPLTCRTFGPPTRFGSEPLPPCDLCFVGATAEEIERCRVEFDPEDFEGALLRRLPDGDRETLVALALGSTGRDRG